MFFDRRLASGYVASQCAAVCLLMLLLPMPAIAAPTPGLEESLGAWREIPLLEDGRVMPLDTFARRHVETICHSQSPKLATLPAGVPVEWHADELLLDWLVRPAAWQDVPFLIAEHEDLRKLLDLPVFETSAGGMRRLKYAAPSDVAESDNLRRRLIDIDDRRREARQSGRSFTLEGVDAKVDQLWQAFVGWRQLTFRESANEVGRSRCVQLFEELSVAWRQVRTQLSATPGVPDAQVASMDETLLSLAESLGQSTRFVTADVLPRIEKARTLIVAMGSVDAVRTEVAARSLRRFSDRLTVFAESLYDNGGGLLAVPALHAQSLETERSAEEDMPPWLSLSILLDAPESVLGATPTTQVGAVRSAFTALSAAVVLEPTDPAAVARRREAAAASSAQLSRALRTLGESVEPLRRGLSVERIDKDLLRYTAYPASGSTRREVEYNRSDPFRISWVASFLAMLAFALAFGRARGPMFSLGTFLLIFELAWTASAFASRIAITQWAPVTNMYETVIYVPFFLSLLGLYFLLAPACGRGVQNAWRMTALPWPIGAGIAGEALPLTAAQQALLGKRGFNAVTWLLFLPRLAGSALVLWVLAMAPYAAGGRTIVCLLPQADIDQSIPNLNNLVVWIVGLCMLAPAVWFFPRVALTALVSVGTVPLSWLGGTLREKLPEVYERRSFGLVVTAVAFAGTFIAWFFPIPGKQFSPLQPVLRDNFWLTIHVLTIVSSYAAGALAWGLGCLSLGYYLVGTYRPSQSLHSGKRPPEACAALAGFIYKSMQVAVLLLAAGTILGGLWADVSWGRFWGWDPKEVWALVSLLAYLIILHGRYAGWIGNFGLAAGSVLGAAVIGMSWYGVNFLLGAGLHSYGFGQGGQTEFFVFLSANFLLLAAAAWRLKMEARAA